MSVSEDHYIWRRIEEWPGIIQEMCVRLVETIANNCRLLSSKKGMQQTISIRRANNFHPGSF